MSGAEGRGDGVWQALAALDPPARFAAIALLLDLDGTLLDIAPTPETVVVPPGLTDDLARLRDRLGGALAVISGRPIAQVDALLGAAPHAVAGEHGGALRRSPDATVERPALAELPAGLRAAAAALADAHPGVRLETKQRGFVLHFRAVPAAGPALHAALLPLLAPYAPALHLQAAHMAWEVRPAGADKGTAVAALLEQPPFHGRLPIFIGDDVTDEDGMAMARRRGGIGLRVAEAFGDAAGVRAWLASLARMEGAQWVG